MEYSLCENDPEGYRLLRMDDIRLKGGKGPSCVGTLGPCSKLGCLLIVRG